MNINDVKTLKADYESQISSKIVELLKIDEQRVSVNWSLEQTVITVNLSNESVISTITFTANDKDVIVNIISYRVMMENNVPVGISANGTAISLSAIQAVQDIIKQVLAKGVNEDATEEGEQDA
jgi:hypothetical protein